MTKKTKISLILLGVVVLIQFIPNSTKSNEAVNNSDFLVQIKPKEQVASILTNSCYNCHSMQSEYPWYSKIAPVSWWINDHINEGRDELNFSDWANYKEKKAQHKLDECIELVEEGEMPLDSYTWMHSEAKLSAEQRSELVSFFKSLKK